MCSSAAECRQLIFAEVARSGADGARRRRHFLFLHMRIRPVAVSIFFLLLRLLFLGLRPKASEGKRRRGTSPL